MPVRGPDALIKIGDPVPEWNLCTFFNPVSSLADQFLLFFSAIGCGALPLQYLMQIPVLLFRRSGFFRRRIDFSAISDKFLQALPCIEVVEKPFAKTLWIAAELVLICAVTAHHDG